MTAKLLLPLDGSGLAERALPWATLLARSREYALVLAQAIPWPPVAADGLMVEYVPANVYDDTMNAEREAATAYLTGVRDRLTSQGLHAEIAVREGSPSTVLLDLADELSVDAIVMATHGRGGLLRALLGSVANYIVQQATIPVLLVRADAVSGRPPALDRLLVPLDGSTFAERALDYATELARRVATVVLARVEESTWAPRGSGQEYDFERPIRGDIQCPASAYLQSLAETMSSKGLHIETDVWRGRPAEQILVGARADDADVIVMATHGRSGPARWLLGSVADEVVRHADRPVLLVSARTAVSRTAEPQTIGDLLTGAPIAVRDDESLAVVLRKLLRQRVTGVGVVNNSGNLIGMLTEREMTDWHDQVMSELALQDVPEPGAYARRLQATPAASIMTRPAPSLDVSTPITQATKVFRERRVARLPVTRDGKLVGILTRTDILKAMAARLQADAGVECQSD